MNIEEMMCDLFGEDLKNTEVVKNETGDAVKVVGDSFEYIRHHPTDCVS